MNETITIIVPIHSKPEYRERVATWLKELATCTQREAGNHFYILHEVTNHPDCFVIYEKWANQAALDSHMRQEYLVNFLRDSRSLLAQEITGMLCREIF